MPITASHENRKLVLNPKFKQQLLRLINLAKEDLNIHVSSKKMIADKQYRLTVLSELDGLGSDLLTELVTQLKTLPVYIQSSPAAPLSIDLEHHINVKKSLWLTICIGFLLVILVAIFVSWQNGHFSLHLEEHSEPFEKSVPQVPRTASKESSEQLSLGEPVISSEGLNKALMLPSDSRVITLRLHGSNTVGEELAPALLQAYLASLSITEMSWLQGEIAGERELQYIQDGQVYGIELHSHGSSTGFQRLLAGDADISMASRKITAAEIEALKATQGDLSNAEQERIIGLDGLAIIVHKNNPVEQLSTTQLAKIFAGEITNWKELGGADLNINLYARDYNSGTWDTFNNLLLKVHKKQLSASSLRFESSHELSDRVALDSGAIGFIGLPYVNKSKALAIAATPDSVVIYPTHFTISTEDYVLARRLYLYAPSSANSMAQGFSNFVTSEQGQNVVDDVGLVSLNIKLEQTYVVKNAPQIYNDYAQIASRLSVNFRFKSGSNELDNKAKYDIKRLVAYLNEHRARRIVLMGFSDSVEDPKMNLQLSLHRARQLEKALNAHGLTITAVEGFGEKLPIASNKTEHGRGKNRRVEVWVF